MSPVEDLNLVRAGGMCQWVAGKWPGVPGPRRTTAGEEESASLDRIGRRCPHAAVGRRLHRPAARRPDHRPDSGADGQQHLPVHAASLVWPTAASTRCLFDLALSGVVALTGRTAPLRVVRVMVGRVHDGLHTLRAPSHTHLALGSRDVALPARPQRKVGTDRPITSILVAPPTIAHQGAAPRAVSPRGAAWPAAEGRSA